MLIMLLTRIPDGRPISSSTESSQSHIRKMNHPRKRLSAQGRGLMSMLVDNMKFGWARKAALMLLASSLKRPWLDNTVRYGGFVSSQYVNIDAVYEYSVSPPFRSETANGRQNIAAQISLQLSIYLVPMAAPVISQHAAARFLELATLQRLHPLEPHM